MARGMKQNELGTLLGVQAATIGRWERGDSSIQRRHLQRLADLMGIPVADLEPRTQAIEIVPQPGGLLDASKVIGRDQLISDLLTNSLAGSHHYLGDPRRMGKTAVLRRLRNQSTDGVLTVLVDLSGVGTVDQAVIRILSAIAESSDVSGDARNRISLYLENAAEIDAGPVLPTDLFNTVGPLPALRDTLERIAAGFATENSMMIIGLDEITLAVQNIAQLDPVGANRFLQTLRMLRSSLPGVSWILAGSIGLHHAVRSAGATMSLFDDLRHVEVGPLEGDGAAELIRAIGRGIGREFEVDAVDELVKLTDGLPMLLHGVTNEISSAGIGLVDGESIRRAFETYIASQASLDWHHVFERFGLYYSDPDLAFQILDSLAVKDEPVTFEDLREIVGTEPESPPDRSALLETLDDLVADGYLASDTLKWRYESLRRIWISRRRLPSA